MSDGALQTVVLEEAVEEAICRHGEEGYPAEVCGLLLGKIEEGRVGVMEAVRAKNVAEKGRQADRYEIDPKDVLAAMNAAAAKGLDVVGVYHSHPDHPAMASKTDTELAWEGWAYVIVSVVKGRAGVVHGWVLRGGTMEMLGMITWGMGPGSSGGRWGG